MKVVTLNFKMTFFVNSIAGKSKRFDALDGDGRVSSMGMGQREYGSCSA